MPLAPGHGRAQGSYYGSRNMRTIFEPALRGLDAVVGHAEGERIAPDAPTGAALGDRRCRSPTKGGDDSYDGAATTRDAGGVMAPT